jgi:hypothetical protein
MLQRIAPHSAEVPPFTVFVLCLFLARSNREGPDRRRCRKSPLGIFEEAPPSPSPGQALAQRPQVNALKSGARSPLEIHIGQQKIHDRRAERPVAMHYVTQVAARGVGKPSLQVFFGSRLFRWCKLGCSYFCPAPPLRTSRCGAFIKVRVTIEEFRKTRKELDSCLPTLSRRRNSTVLHLW